MSDRILLDLAARTATVSSPTQHTPGWRGAHVTIKATAKTATPSVVPTIEGYDTASGSWYTILAGVAVTDAGTVTLKVYPGITAANNVSASDVLPAVWRVTMTAGDTDSLTYSVGANLLP